MPKRGIHLFLKEIRNILRAIKVYFTFQISDFYDHTFYIRNFVFGFGCRFNYSYKWLEIVNCTVILQAKEMVENIPADFQGNHFSM